MYNMNPEENIQIRAKINFNYKKCYKMSVSEIIMFVENFVVRNKQHWQQKHI